MIKVGSDFSGVGAFDQALIRLGVEYKTVFACDMDKYARQTYVHNYGEPEYYPENVYDREIPKKPLDIYMTSPPCQAFSLAGKRKGEADKRGILFYNSHEFIKKNNPRYFIFENVKGLLSDDTGKTFNRWLDYLGGKSINGNPVIFPHEESVPYHIYWQVLNAKDCGVPQNRERVFIIGIRDDADNYFSFPKTYTLAKRLKDILDENVEDKYFLSDTMLNKITFNQKENGEVANLNKGGERGSVYSNETPEMSCLSATDYKQPKQIMVSSATSNGYELAQEGDSINSGCNEIRGGYTNQLTDEVVQLNSSKESGGKQPYQQNRIYADYGVMTTLDTDSGRKSVYTDYKIRRLTPRECFRLMDFPDTFTWPVSDSQAYKQAGNSIAVQCLVELISKLKL